MIYIICFVLVSVNCVGATVIAAPEFKGKIGTIVFSLEKGKVITEKNANTLFTPASLVKLFVSASFLYFVEGSKASATEDLLYRMNKHSDNFAAKKVLNKLAKLDKTGSGINKIYEYLDLKSINNKSLKIVDGTGLSRKNKMTPRHAFDLLLEIFNSGKEGREAFTDLLSVPGESGTLEKRMTNIGKDVKIRAKTGSLRGVCNIAGFINDKVIFVIMMEGFTLSINRVKNIQDEFIEKISRELVEKGLYNKLH